MKRTTTIMLSITIMLLLTTTALANSQYHIPKQHKGLTGIAPHNSLSILKTKQKITSTIIISNNANKKTIAQQKAHNLLSAKTKTSTVNKQLLTKEILLKNFQLQKKYGKLNDNV